MKIVHVQQYYNEGYGYQENIFPEYQKDLGHDVVMLTSTRSDGFNGEDREKKAGEFVENNILVKRLEISWEFKKRFVRFKNLYSQLEAEQPDYLYHHSATSPSIFTCARYKKHHKEVTLVVDNHADLQISGRNKLWKLFYYNVFWKLSIFIVDKYIDKYFGVTPDRCKFLEKELGVKNDKIELLPIGADVRSIHSAETSNNFKKNLDINNKIIFCSGGKMTIEKKYDQLIKGFKQVENNNLILILFGSFEDKYLEKLIESDSRIIFLGWKNREEVITIMKNSDLGIWNGQHTTLLEDAIACELPLLLRKYGSTEHLVEGNGDFVLDGNALELSSKLNDILDNNMLTSFKTYTGAMKEKISYETIAKKSLEVVKS